MVFGWDFSFSQPDLALSRLSLFGRFSGPTGNGQISSKSDHIPASDPGHLPRGQSGIPGRLRFADLELQEPDGPNFGARDASPARYDRRSKAMDCERHKCNCCEVWVVAERITGTLIIKGKKRLTGMNAAAYPLTRLMLLDTCWSHTR